MRINFLYKGTRMVGMYNEAAGTIITASNGILNITDVTEIQYV